LSTSGQRILQTALAVVQFHHLHFGAGQFAVGRQHIEVARLGTLARRRDIRRAQHDLVGRCFQSCLVDACAHRGIALRVEVDQQYALVQFCQTGGQVNSGGSFTYAALLICYAKNFCHVFLIVCCCY
jgi:hypothetical protein